jgi:hypothetical protein
VDTGKRDKLWAGRKYVQTFYQLNDQYPNQSTAPGDGQNNILTNYADANWFFDIYDAYYNGSITMTLTPPASQSKCSKITSKPINNTYFRIGAMERPGNSTYSRKVYDYNNWYFRLGRNQIGSDYKCPVTPDKAFIGFESSNSNLETHVGWNLTGARSWGQHKISGVLSSDKASYNNHFNYLLSADEEKSGCPSHFQAFSLTQAYNVSMAGTASAAKVSITWSFTDVKTGWNVQGGFNGDAWSGGATLNVASDKPETMGQAKRVVPPNESFWKKFGKIVIGVVVGGVVSCRLSLSSQRNVSNSYAGLDCNLDRSMLLLLVHDKQMLWPQEACQICKDGR